MITEKRMDYRVTLFACALAYLGQTIVYNYLPLLYMIFYAKFNIPFNQIALLTTINFTAQIVIGFFIGKIADIIGYRFCAVTMEILVIVGMVLVVVLTQTMANTFLALVLSFAVIGIGAGIVEAMNPAFIQSCPIENKTAVNSFVYSFSSWSYAVVVLLSTLFFVIFGTRAWRILTLLWIIVPLMTLFMFCRIKFYHVEKQYGNKNTSMTLQKMLSMKLYWQLMIVMFCADACDVGYSQWISSFMESALGMQKVIGDLVGPSLFAIGCGISRLVYAIIAKHVRLRTCMITCFIGSTVGFVLTALSQSIALSIIGCIFSGLCIGNLYPGAIALVSEEMPEASTQTFTLLTVAGGIGGAITGTMIGSITAKFENNLRIGFASGFIWPIMGFLVVLTIKNSHIVDYNK